MGEKQKGIYLLLHRSEQIATFPGDGIYMGRFPLPCGGLPI